MEEPADEPVGTQAGEPAKEPPEDPAGEPAGEPPEEPAVEPPEEPPQAPPDEPARVTVHRCPRCGEETVHDVLKRRGRERTIRCRECDRVQPVVEPRRLDVAVQLSRGGQTESRSVEVAEDDRVAVGDRLLVAGGIAEVTAVEDREGRRPDEAPAPDIRTVWARDIQRLTVPVTVHRGRTSDALSTVLGPAEAVTVGDTLVVQGRRVRVDRIKARTGIVRRAGRSVEAPDIVRVYAYPAEG